LTKTDMLLIFNNANESEKENYLHTNPNEGERENAICDMRVQKCGGIRGK